jgi:hypothetical protein
MLVERVEKSEGEAAGPEPKTKVEVKGEDE